MKDKGDKAALQEAINIVRGGLKDEFTQLRMYNTRIEVTATYLSFVRLSSESLSSTCSARKCAKRSRRGKVEK